MKASVYISLILKNVIYGSSILFVSKLVSSVDVLDVLSIRFLLSAIIFAILAAFKVIKIDLKGKNIRPLLYVGLFEPILYFLFETIGVSMTSNIVAGVICALAPTACCVIEELVLKEKINIKQKMCILLSTIGVIYMCIMGNTQDGKTTIVGIICMFLAVLSGALFMAFSRKASADYNSFEISYISAMMGAVVFNAINIVRHIVAMDIDQYFAPLMSLDNIIGFIFLSFISTIVATTLNNYALSKFHTSRASAFGSISTITTIVNAAIFNNEKIMLFHIIGITIIMIGIIGVNKFSKDYTVAASKSKKSNSV